MEMSKLYLSSVLNIYYNVIESGRYFQLRHNYKQANHAIFSETCEGWEYYILILILYEEFVQSLIWVKGNQICSNEGPRPFQGGNNNGVDPTFIIFIALLKSVGSSDKRLRSESSAEYLCLQIWRQNVIWRPVSLATESITSTLCFICHSTSRQRAVRTQCTHLPILSMINIGLVILYTYKLVLRAKASLWFPEMWTMTRREAGGQSSRRGKL